MKRVLTLLLVALCFGLSSQAQHLVYLKDGSIIKGEVLEFKTRGKTIVKTADGSQYAISSYKIKSIVADKDVTRNNSNKFEAPRGYRGFVELTPYDISTEGEGISLTTTHGYQFSHYAFLGAGVGATINYDGEQFYAPAFITFKGNAGRGRVQFTYGVRLGASYARYFESEQVDDNGSMHYYMEEVRGFTFYSNYNLGIRIAASPNFAVSLTPELTLGGYGISTGLRVGFEF